MKKQTKNKKVSPEIGQNIYVGSSLYLGHAVDDFHGGLCKILRVEDGISAGEKTLFIEVAERLGFGYNWDILSKEQGRLKKQFGNQRGYKCPDYDPRFNEDF
ncbi:MAG: hypothetical protein PHH54_01185 [Candidatus Nanoarchaeia archaeon]|nr:hypothetical protein [Candidatus Nanoarchaeia archaeon]MDD5740577.1 hypothetical protein [Candidatus Nanoarchaeia archaeon]